MTGAEDIKQFAKNILGYEIMPFQMKMVEAILDGISMIGGRQSGRATAKKIAFELMVKDMLDRKEWGNFGRRP